LNDCKRSAIGHIKIWLFANTATRTAVALEEEQEASYMISNKQQTA